MNLSLLSLVSLLLISLVSSEYLAVKLSTSISPETLSLDHDLTFVKSHMRTQWHVYEVEVNEKRSIDHVKLSLEEDDRVDVFEHLPVKKMVKKSSVESAWKRIERRQAFPFDDPQGGDQWHLNFIEAPAAWDESTGAGILVQVVDDGVDFGHEDLASKENTANAWSFLSEDTIVLPITVDNSHGTACAGLVAAVADNNNCGCGVAYDADLAGIKLLDTPASDAVNAEAMNGHIDDVFVSTNSWGSQDADGLFYTSAHIFKDALEDGTQNGRDGKGIVYLWAAGNGGISDNCNRDEYSQGPYIISVTGINRNSDSAYFSELCTANFVTSPTIDLVTVSTDGECIDTFSGTSGSTPIVAGITALILQVDPDLTYRDVMHILQQSAQIVDSTNPDWITNAAGIKHSDIYGFGVVNAKESVLLAKDWENVESLKINSQTQSESHEIPDNGTLSLNMEVTATGELEHVVVWVDITHTYRLDLDIFITSPSGVQSKLIQAATSTLEYSPNAGASEIFHIDGPLAEDVLTGSYDIYILYSEEDNCQSVYSWSGTPLSDIPEGAVALYVPYYENTTSCYPEVIELFENQGFVAFISLSVGDNFMDFESTIPSYVMGPTDANVNVLFEELEGDVVVSFTKNQKTGHAMQPHTLTTVKHWGEDPSGTWTLTINDRREEDVGSISSWRLDLFGVLEGITVATTELETIESSITDDDNSPSVQLHFPVLPVVIILISMICF